jgi:hypothetical protein
MSEIAARGYFRDVKAIVIINVAYKNLVVFRKKQSFLKRMYNSKRNA